MALKPHHRRRSRRVSKLKLIYMEIALFQQDIPPACQNNLVLLYGQNFCQPVCVWKDTVVSSLLN